MWPQLLSLILESSYVFLPNIFLCIVFSIQSCTGWADSDYMILTFIECNKGHCLVWCASVCESARWRPLESRLSMHASNVTSFFYRREHEASGRRGHLPVFTRGFGSQGGARRQIAILTRSVLCFPL